MRNSLGWAVFLSMTAANTAVAAPIGPPASAAISQQPTRVQGRLPLPTGRLKFKSPGPVCICGEGLSERDIEQAMAKFRSDKVATPDSDASRSRGGNPEKTLNSGVSK